MIKTVIKRDGRKEEFSPNKINRWGQWAARTLGDKVDWPSIVLATVQVLPEECSSIDLHERLIKTCLDNNTWSYNRMAGRLYAGLIHKNLYNDSFPTVKQLHDKLYTLGFMVKLDYSDEEYAEVEKVINHKLDFQATHFELHQVRTKYSLQNRATGEEFESQQFVYMRMAMALAEDQPEGRRMHDVQKWYEHFSQKRINAPTPNYVNLGTPLRGYASCCVWTTRDTAPSIQAGVDIAYTMTCMSAGIGGHLNVRSLGDPVRGGVIEHGGKLPYYRYVVGAVQSSLQNGRGGACTMHFNAYDPEVEVITRLKNPMSTEDKKIRGMDYSFGSNKFFARKAAKGEDVFLFNAYTAPDLVEALYSPDQEKFEALYEKYERNRRFKKTYVSARDVLIAALNEAYEVGREYLHFIDEMNRHTPFKDPIYSSNLCQEIALPTKGYDSVKDLYSSEESGEIGLCSLSGIVVGNIEDDAQYEEVMYYALLMIDKCIHKSEYVYPNLEMTAKSRLSAGVGIIGLAHLMAKNHLMYSSQEGKDFIHALAEKHMYFAIKASLRLSKEFGVAPWMHKTKWPDGWLPIDTYNKNVDSVVTTTLQYDWESLRKEIVENGGIRNSVLIAHMPSESSSKASGTTNGVYPIRELTLLKGDNTAITYWAATDGDKIGKWYESAWDIPTKDMIDVYAILQKFTDQAISADLWRRVLGGETVPATEMLQDYFYMVKMGIKSRYYMNSKTTDGGYLTSDEDGGNISSFEVDEAECESCKL